MWMLSLLCVCVCKCTEVDKQFILPVVNRKKNRYVIEMFHNAIILVQVMPLCKMISINIDLR